MNKKRNNKTVTNVIEFMRYLSKYPQSDTSGFTLLSHNTQIPPQW